ncbi:MAG: hypothetical protein QNJ64_14130 [Crocosphaera sp.]|nr:hypothetical protein [Crocosphaera sp.]
MSQSKDKRVNQIETLLTRYGFEVKQVTITELIETWLASYSAYWIRLAIIEALYQGRYKAVSVEHILALWKRLGHPVYHFTYEFERLITRHIFLEEVTNNQQIHQSETVEESVCIDKPIEVTPKNTVTFTPIQELVKKIVIPVSISAQQLSRKADTKELSHDFTIESPKTEEDDSDKQKIETSIQLIKPTPAIDIEKAPRSIHQFVPPSDSSDFYSKLRAVAYHTLEEDGGNGEWRMGNGEWGI